MNHYSAIIALFFSSTVFAQQGGPAPATAALPDAPSALSAETYGLGQDALQEVQDHCALLGTVQGPDGKALPDASLVFHGKDGSQERTVNADGNGRYKIEDVPCGEYTLKISTPGFAQLEVRGKMGADGELRQENVVLEMAGVAESVKVEASEADVAQAQMELEEKQRIAGVFPNFYVSYDWSASPLNSRQKFQMALRSAADPVNLGTAALVAGVQQANNSLPGYGQGAAGYGRRFGANLGDDVIGTFVGAAILPAIFHQDPRYFYRGTGTTRSRLWYAVSRAFVTRGDNGHTQPNFSNLFGGLSAGAISNLYAAREDRQGTGLTIRNGLLGILGDSVNNTIQEFFLRRVTRQSPDAKARLSQGKAMP